LGIAYFQFGGIGFRVGIFYFYAVKSVRGNAGRKIREIYRKKKKNYSAPDYEIILSWAMKEYFTMAGAKGAAERIAAATGDRLCALDSLGHLRGENFKKERARTGTGGARRTAAVWGCGRSGAGE